MSRAVLVITVKNFGKGNGLVSARLGKKVYGFDWDSSVIKKGEEDSHILSVARMVRDTVQSALPTGRRANLDESPLVYPESLSIDPTWAYVFTIDSE